MGEYPSTSAAQTQSTGSGTGAFTPRPAGTARAPRGFLIIDRKRIALISLSTSSNSHFTADGFTAVLSTQGQPQGFNLLQWDQLSVGATVQVCYGFLQQGQLATDLPTGGNSTVIMTGVIDTIEANILSDGTITVSGRDLTAKLIDTKTANHYLNMTASEAVTMVAKQFGLTPQVTTTKTPIGKYQNDQYSSMSNSTPYWDLITDWANQENFDAYVANGVLYFGPAEADSDPSPWKFFVELDPHTGGQRCLNSNVKTMKLTRNCNLSKDITVTVLSHNSQTDRTIIAYASATGTRVPTSSRNSDASTVDNYLFRKPGMTQAQAQNLANAKLSEITKFEREFRVTLEGSPILTTRKKIMIVGTGTDFDTSYYIRTISRKWAPGSGFEMTVTGKNVPPPSDGGPDDDDT